MERAGQRVQVHVVETPNPMLFGWWPGLSIKNVNLQKEILESGSDFKTKKVDIIQNGFGP